MNGGVNSNFLVLDSRWGLKHRDLINVELHIHNDRSKIYTSTKTVGVRGNSIVFYIPKCWNIPVGTLCVAEITLVSSNEEVK